MKALPLILVFAMAHFCGGSRNSNLSDTSSNIIADNGTPDGSFQASNKLSTDATRTGNGDWPLFTVSGGMLNGKAKSLPLPEYPTAARSANAKGEVIIHVLVDEGGSVVMASAVKGHPNLRRAAEVAAKKAQFDPLILPGGKAAKVSGVLIYQFDPDQR